MTPEEQITKLREQIAYHSDRYYNQDNPEISDYEFDQLMLELKRLEREPSRTGHAGFADAEGGRCREADGGRAGKAQCPDVKRRMFSQRKKSMILWRR